MVPEEQVLYNYNPSLEAAAIFAALFFIATLIHIVHALQCRAYYLAPLVIGGFFEWIGYIGRALAHNRLDNLGIFIFQTILLLLAPAFFAATIYMILCRIIISTRGESLIPVRWMTAIFVCGDGVSFMVQATGGGLMGKGEFTIGERLIILGLGLQIAFFGFFVITGGIFHYRMRMMKKHMVVLYIASTLILIRSIFRTIEFSGGYNGYLMKDEAFLYGYDSILMLGVMVCFVVVHPGGIRMELKEKGCIA